MSSYREVAYALLRVTMGMMLPFYGIGKFMMGVSNFAAMMEKQFTGKLPLALVTPFAYKLPFAEVITGALITLGLFNRIALALSGFARIVGPIIAQKLCLPCPAGSKGSSLPRDRSRQ